MNQLDNIERLDTSGHDKTCGNSFQEQQAYADAVRRQRQAYDACDLAENVDNFILELAKEGKAELIGSMLITSMNATIARRVAQEGWK